MVVKFFELSSVRFMMGNAEIKKRNCKLNRKGCKFYNYQSFVKSNCEKKDKLVKKDSIVCMEGEKAKW